MTTQQSSEQRTYKEAEAEIERLVSGLHAIIGCDLSWDPRAYAQSLLNGTEDEDDPYPQVVIATAEWPDHAKELADA